MSEAGFGIQRHAAPTELLHLAITVSINMPLLTELCCLKDFSAFGPKIGTLFNSAMPAESVRKYAAQNGSSFCS